MAKRFTDTEKWDDPFFLDMPADMKLVYFYILDKCDAAGVWKVNKRMVEFCVAKIDWEKFISYMGKRVHVIEDDKWWITKFCDFQYGTLSEESKSKPVISHINLLKKHRLWIGYTKGIDTLKEKEKDKDKVEVKDKVKVKEVKHKYGEYKNVLLTDTEMGKLKDEFPGDWVNRVEKVSEYCSSQGKTYKNYLATIRSWAKNETKTTALDPNWMNDEFVQMSLQGDIERRESHANTTRDLLQ